MKDADNPAMTRRRFLTARKSESLLGTKASAAIADTAAFIFIDGAAVEGPGGEHLAPLRHAWM